MQTEHTFRIEHFPVAAAPAGESSYMRRQRLRERENSGPLAGRIVLAGPLGTQTLDLHDPWHGKQSPCPSYGAQWVVRLTREAGGPYFRVRGETTWAYWSSAEHFLKPEDAQCGDSPLPQAFRVRLWLALAKDYRQRHARHFVFGIRPEWREWLAPSLSAKDLVLGLDAVTADGVDFTLYMENGGRAGMLEVRGTFHWDAQESRVTLRRQMDGAGRGMITAGLAQACHLARGPLVDGRSAVLSQQGHEALVALHAQRVLLGGRSPLVAAQRDLAPLTRFPATLEDLRALRSRGHITLIGDREYFVSGTVIRWASVFHFMDDCLGIRHGASDCRHSPWDDNYAKVVEALREMDPLSPALPKAPRTGRHADPVRA